MRFLRFLLLWLWLRLLLLWLDGSSGGFFVREWFLRVVERSGHDFALFLREFEARLERAARRSVSGREFSGKLAIKRARWRDRAFLAVVYDNFVSARVADGIELEGKIAARVKMCLGEEFSGAVVFNFIEEGRASGDAFWLGGEKDGGLDGLCGHEFDGFVWGRYHARNLDIFVRDQLERDGRDDARVEQDCQDPCGSPASEMSVMRVQVWVSSKSGF